MTIKDRAAAITRGKQALRHLEQHPDTTRTQLGNARDVLNRIHNWPDAESVRDAVEGIESIVVDVYGRHPEEVR